MQNLTLDSCSATPISYWGDEISRLSCLVMEIPILGYRYLGFWGFLGYLFASGAKSDVIWYTVTYRFKCWIKQCSRLFCFSHAELRWRRGWIPPPSPLSIRCLQKSLAMRGLTGSAKIAENAMAVLDCVLTDKVQNAFSFHLNVFIDILLLRRADGRLFNSVVWQQAKLHCSVDVALLAVDAEHSHLFLHLYCSCCSCLWINVFIGNLEHLPLGSKSTCRMAGAMRWIHIQTRRILKQTRCGGSDLVTASSSWN